MIARARLVAAVDGCGRTVLTELRSAPPLALRETPEAVYLVGSAGGPLGGDRTRLELEVAAGASLVVRSAAATVALPGPGPEESRFEVDATVGEGACLVFEPEPTVAAAGSRHRVMVRLRLAPGARLRWRDELILGRHGEEPGAAILRLHVDIGDRPVLRTELRLGPGAPGWSGPAVTGGARAVGSLLLVDPEAAPAPAPATAPDPGATVATFQLAPGVVQVIALANDAVELRAQLEQSSSLQRSIP